ncbi:hypothetical protein E4U39_005115 [Claviceps sp. Clav50 group G5]|nr:hypothetical protein E4U39_005115 [Claviceps sp. Clav50 group G5]
MSWTANFEGWDLPVRITPTSDSVMRDICMLDTNMVLTPLQRQAPWHLLKTSILKKHCGLSEESIIPIRIMNVYCLLAFEEDQPANSSEDQNSCYEVPAAEVPTADDPKELVLRVRCDEDLTAEEPT